MADTLALIIGGTSGIGRAVALRFATEGMRVVVTGRDAARGRATADACRAAGTPEAAFLPVDVSEVDHRQSVRRKQFGDLVEAGTRVQGDLLAFGVHGRQSAQVAQVQPDVVGGGDGGEAVPGADRLHGGA